jgi:hypothetical protein
MAVNTTEISSVYDTLLAAMVAKYDAMWAANEIDAEAYAQLVGQASSQLVQLSADLVQKQEALDKDTALKQAQIDIAAQELLIKQKQVEVQETELRRVRAITEAELEKQWGYGVTRDPITDDIVLGGTTGTGVVDYEATNLQKQGAVLEAQTKNAYSDRVLKDKQAAKLGLDNVMKLAEAERVSDVNYVYTPRYEEV